METPYKAIGFEQHDILERHIMDQNQSNLQWIKDNTPRGRVFRDSGRGIDTNLRLVVGREHIRADKKSDTARVEVKFGGNAFDADCHPHITFSVVNDLQRNIFCVVKGPRGARYPNADGFEIWVNINSEKDKNDFIKKDFFVHWHAFGYRKVNLNEF